MDKKFSKLSIEDITQRLDNLEGWGLVRDSITKKFIFRDFREAMDFVNDVAILAEEAGHHPDIMINYNKVELSMSTHSAGGLTEMDFSLAEKINSLKQG